jgi:hypothetical protein
MNMKTRQSRRQAAKVSRSRWLAYATASAATALAGSHSAEAAIHYSGLLREHFPPDQNKTKTFPLDQAGDSLFFGRASVLAARGPTGSETPLFQFNEAVFTCFGIVSAAFRGPRASGDNYYNYASRLPFGENISAGNFTHGSFHYGLLASGARHIYSQWGHRGTGFVGFRFNSGAGMQYGWARVSMVGGSRNAFTVLDYAYADPGEPIGAGQRRSNEQVAQQGSVGLLAIGAVGLLVWRKNRSRTAG